MKRYKAINFEYDDAYGTGTALDIVEHDEGEFVKYEDIKQLLQKTASNSDYAKCCGTCLNWADSINGMRCTKIGKPVLRHNVCDKYLSLFNVCKLERI